MAKDPETERQLADDLRLYGVSFERDGKRVDPFDVFLARDLPADDGSRPWDWRS